MIPAMFMAAAGAAPSDRRSPLRPRRLWSRQRQARTPARRRRAAPGPQVLTIRYGPTTDVLQGRLMTTRKRKYAPIPLPATRQSEEAGDKSSLSPDVAPVEVSNLALPDHREGLEACQGSR